jgi:hypothetical protein
MGLRCEMSAESEEWMFVLQYQRPAARIIIMLISATVSYSDFASAIAFKFCQPRLIFLAHSLVDMR